MKSLVANLTVVALLAHAAAGCCWHHGHLAAGGPSRPAVKPVVCGGHFAWHEDHDHRRSDEGSENHHHDESDGCDHGACSFASQNVRPQFSSPLTANCAVAGLPAAPEAARIAGYDAGSGLRQPGSPVALHLLHGVFLI